MSQRMGVAWRSETMVHTLNNWQKGQTQCILQMTPVGNEDPQLTVSKYTYTVVPKHVNAMQRHFKISFIPAAHTWTVRGNRAWEHLKRQERESDRAGMRASVKSPCSALKHQSCRLGSSCLCRQAPLKLYFMERTVQSLLICSIRDRAPSVDQLLKQVGLDNF